MSPFGTVDFYQHNQPSSVRTRAVPIGLAVARFLRIAMPPLGWLWSVREVGRSSRSGSELLVWVSGPTSGADASSRCWQVQRSQERGWVSGPTSGVSASAGCWHGSSWEHGGWSSGCSLRLERPSCFVRFDVVQRGRASCTPTARCACACTGPCTTRATLRRDCSARGRNLDVYLTSQNPSLVRNLPTRN